MENGKSELKKAFINGNVTWSDWTSMATERIDSAINKYDILLDIVPKVKGILSVFIIPIKNLQQILF